MADVLLDTPIAAYGLPMVLLPPSEVGVAHALLSPVSRTPADAVDAWWSRVPVIDVELPRVTQRARPTRPGAWDVPPGGLVATLGDLPAEGTGLFSAQTGVNGDHVEALTALAARSSGWLADNPVRVALIGGRLWLLDGVHRTCAALATGRTTVRAQVVDLAAVATCPCGWGGAPGEFLTHACPGLP